MQSVLSGTRRDRFELGGDGALITAGVFAVLTGGFLGLINALPDAQVSDNIVVQLASLVLIVGGSIAGPVMAWRLHGRKIDLMAVVGAVVGMLCSVPVFFLLVALTAPLGWILRPFTTSEYAGPLALLAIVSLAYLALIVWLLIDAVRDYAPAKREHRNIDIARILAALALVAFGVGVTVIAMQPGMAETTEAFIFAYVSGMGGALAVTGADVAQNLAKRGQAAPAGAAPA